MKLPPRGIQFGLIGVVVALALYAGLGFILVPTLAHRQIEKRGSAALARSVTVAAVDFNPFTFATEIERLRVAGRGEAGDFFTLERAYLNFDALESLLRWQWRFGEVTLTAPAARLAVNDSGELSVADLFAGQGNASDNEAGAVPRIGVDRLVIETGSIEFADQSRETPFDLVIQPIAFTLENFSTASGAAGTYQLAGRTSTGESLAWSGNLVAAPFASQGRIEITSVDVPSYQPFFARLLAGEIRSGRADLSANYDIALGGERHAFLRDVQLRLTDAALALPQTDDPAVVLPSLEVAMPQVDLFAGSAHVTSVALDGLAVAAVRERDGTINLSRFLAAQDPRPDEGGGQETQSGAGAKSFNVRIDRIALQNGNLQLIDRTPPEPMQLEADQIVVTLTDVSSDPAAEAGVEMTLRWMEGPGSLSANGTLARAPLKANLQISGAQLELAAFAPFLRQFADVQIGSGRGEVEGRLELSRTGAEPVAVRWTGRISVDELTARDRTFDHDLVQWSKLVFEGIDFSLTPDRLAVREIRLEQPSFHVLLGPDGNTNLTATFGGTKTQTNQSGEESSAAAESTASGSPASEGGAAATMPITLGSVVLAGGTLTLTDQSGEEPMETKVTAMEGTLSGLSTEPRKPGQLQLTASVLDSAPATLQGEVNLIGADILSGTNVTLDLRGVSLDPLQPYVVRFLGYRVQQGRMQGDFEYNLSAGTLAGSNHVVLDDFYLGEQVNSPDALAVPVKLALAVLRNRDGQVVLDVPVSGSLKSPEFSFADAIRGAFGNILGKVATAPFALLGSMFGAPETDLSLAEFPAGSTELTDETRRKLDVLTRALQDRPGLKLVIQWQPTPEADREAARRQRLSELIAQQRERLQTASGGGDVTEVEALRALFSERIRGESFAATQAPMEADRAPETEAERDAWYAQAWQWFWGPWPEGREPQEPPPSTEPAPVGPELGEEQMRQELLASLEVEQGALEALAQSRAHAARDLLASAGIDPQRIEVTREPAESPADGGATARVAFELAQSDPGMVAE